MSTATIASPAPTRSQPVARKGFWRGMLWVTWRQHRAVILISTAVTAGMLIWMLKTVAEIDRGLRMPSGSAVTRAQGDARIAVLNHGYSFATYELNTVVSLPILIGLFIGVPVLAREYEQRTLMLAWSQDVSPQKWLWSKLAILGAFVAVAGAALAGVSEHLAHLAAVANGRSLFEGTLFQGGGWMPLTLSLAWFAFGVAAGGVARRLLPAFGVVVAAFVGRTVLMVKYRPEFMKPVTATRYFTSGSGIPGFSDGRGGGGDITNGQVAVVPNDMSITGGGYIDTAGHVRSVNDVMGTMCGTTKDVRGQRPQDAILACMHQNGIVGTTNSYQPANRMGTFHLIENSTNLGLMVVALLVTWWCVCRARTPV